MASNGSLNAAVAKSGAWPAPAKLNLFLHITGRRADGYHLLQTVFQFLDYGDELTFEPTATGQIRPRYTLPGGVPPEQDLIVRAAMRLRETAGVAAGATIDLHKRLPMGGGLGGGSSDAATTLVALNTLWECGLSVAELAELGLALGADVPVFVRAQAAWAEGVGEQLQPVTLPQPWFLVVKPPIEVSTREVFGAPELTRDCDPITIQRFLEVGAGNVFEPVVRARYPEVDRVMRWLAEFGRAQLTGSGSCVFLACDSAAAAVELQHRVPQQWLSFVAQGVNRSPLQARLTTSV